MVSDSSPSRGNIGRLVVESSLEVISNWVTSLQGTGEFKVALERLLSLIGADAAVLFRIDEGKQKHIAIVDRQTRKMFSPRDRPSFAREIFSDEIGSAKSGTVWLLSDSSDHGGIENANLTAKFKEFCVRDVAVVTLEASCRTSYYLEFHFSSIFSEHNRVVLLTLAGTLSKTWANRDLGAARAIELSTRLTVEPKSDRARSVNILAPNNPIGLSRSEFRVCLMVREGLNAKRVAEELVIGEATVRTHLSSIFAKAGVSGHIELLHRLSMGHAHASRRSAGSI